LPPPATSANIADFEELLAEAASSSHFRQAAAVEQGVPVYDASPWSGQGSMPTTLQSEVATVLTAGPGTCVFKNAFPDHDLLDAVTQVFHAIIDYQRSSSALSGDHFAPPGTNDRVWGALDKLCFASPALFADYYSNAALAGTALAYLGPYYQVTSQVNLVRPGCPAQTPHCDYHLGFMRQAELVQFPLHVHQFSSFLTLQMAIAHCDMPVDTGPTMLLPYSQLYPWRYVGALSEDFRNFFRDHFVQLSLRKGDLLVFNPGLYHAAGENRTPAYQRLANLLQISSAFGRPLESTNRRDMCLLLLPVLQQKLAEGWERSKLCNVIASAAEGYPFPTNLDLDVPRGELIPRSGAELLLTATEASWGVERLEAELDAMAARRQPPVPSDAKKWKHLLSHERL